LTAVRNFALSHSYRLWINPLIRAIS